MKLNRILFAGLITAFAISAGTAQAQSVFTDVPDNHWAAAAVKRLALAGIIEGYPAAPAPRRGQVNTNVAITRQAVITDPGAVAHALIYMESIRNPFLKGIAVNVTSKPINNTVILTGTVKNAGQKQLVEAIANKQSREFINFKIINQLKIEPNRTR